MKQPYEKPAILKHGPLVDVHGALIRAEERAKKRYEEGFQRYSGAGALFGENLEVVANLEEQYATATAVLKHWNHCESIAEK